MGWTSYHADHYRNGKVDRKSECDAYFMSGLNAGNFKVEKSAMVGSTYYAAVTPLRFHGEIIPQEDRTTFAVVFLTSTTSKDYFNFAYKDMDETMLPYYFDCPSSILALLTPTDNANAVEWRRRCRERSEKRKNGTDLRSLKIGTIIEFEDSDGKISRYVKHAPAFQFKTPFWYNPESNQYIPKTRIPDNYRIVYNRR